MSRRKPQEDDSEADVGEQRVCGKTKHLCRVDKIRHAANLERDKDAQGVSSASALAHAVLGFPIIVPASVYNWSMTLSSALVGALRSFNRMDPMARAGMLPIADGSDFVKRVMSSPSNQSQAPAGSGSPPLDGAAVSQTQRELVEEAGESIQKAKLDPYVFSPPGMD